MGTSKSYSAPPSWGGLKSNVTRSAKEGALSRHKAQQLLRSFIQHNGGAKAIANGTGTVAVGQAARFIAGRLGYFLSDINRFGFQTALLNAGWKDLIGGSVQEILAALLDRLGGEATTIDDVDARMALSRLQEEYFSDSADVDELEQRLSEQVNDIAKLLRDFFGYYLYEVFCRVFYERLAQRIGESRAHSFLNEIGDFIKSLLANRVTDVDMTNIDWSGKEGDRIITDIMETTLNIFGG